MHFAGRALYTPFQTVILITNTVVDLQSSVHDEHLNAYKTPKHSSNEQRTDLRHPNCEILVYAQIDCHYCPLNDEHHASKVP